MTSHRPWSTAVALAAGTLTVIDATRVWLPSAVLRWGNPEAVAAPGAAATGLPWWLWLSVLVAPSVAALVALRRLPPVVVTTAGAAVMVLARLLLQAAHGDGQQLFAASAVLAGVALWLIGMASGPAEGRPVAAGVTIGTAAALVEQVTLRTIGASWYTGIGPWVGVTVIGVLLLVTSVRASTRDRDGGGRDGGEPAPPGLWWTIGPALFLAVTVTANAARADATAGWGGYQPAFVLLAAAGVAVAAAVRARRLSRSPFVAALLVVGAVAAATVPVAPWHAVVGLQPPWSVWAQAAAVIGVALALGWGAEGVRFTPPWRRGAAATAGLFGLGVGLAGALAAPAHQVPWWLIAAGVAIAVGGTAGAGSAHTWSPPPRRRGAGERAAVPIAVAVTLLTLTGSLLALSTQRQPITARAAAAYPLRVASYDIHAGYDLHSRFNPVAAGQTLAATHPAIVVLTGVDRGSAAAGGHDTLQLMAETLGMPIVYAPAANPLHGNAVLARFPVVSARSEVVSAPGAPVTATALSVVFRLDDGSELGVVVTQWSASAGAGDEVDAARRVARIAADLTTRRRPVVVAGALGAQPGSAAFTLLTADLTDALAAARPLPTYPADHPRFQVDHILLSGGLRATGARAVPAGNSTHRPVVVDLAPAS